MPSASTQAKSMHYEPWAINVYHRETPPRERKGEQARPLLSLSRRYTRTAESAMLSRTA